MAPETPVVGEVTRVLTQISEGETSAADRLLSIVYEELHRLAVGKLAQEKPGHTLQATALVHEAWLRLVPANHLASIEDGRQFFAAAAAAMRRILIDSARRRRTQKRGGELHRQPLDDIAGPLSDSRLLALEEALKKLAVEHPDKATLVELRFFAGLTGDQAAKFLGISPATADRHWTFARAWLRMTMGDL